ncbi:hypothetical protein L1887_09386 [Cichorium endivia]|nr:hypothetical protein L1887_09386 [Cichorium endivia]
MPTSGGSVNPPLTNNSGLVDLDDPISLHANDISCVTIISFKLLGTINYHSWATTTERALTIRNKLGFINGECTRPTDDVSKAIKWDRANAVVVSWLLSSMSDSISSTYILSKKASELWLELKQTFEKINGSVIFNVYQKINLHTQGSDNVSDYFNSLNGLWKEFDSLSNLSVCTCAAFKDHQSFSNQLKVMQFLMGLNDTYSQIRSNILMHETLPSVQSAFSTISREESLKGSSVPVGSSKSQSSVFVSKGPDLKKQNGKGSNLICKHCNMKGHTIERCYKLIGFPKDFKPRNESIFLNKPNANNAVSDPIANTCNENKVQMQFSNDQVIKLLGLINEKAVLGDASANMAGTHTFVNTNKTNTVVHNVCSQRKWIIDSGATQHMTASSSNLENLIDVSDLKMQVDHPNGTFAKISKIGSLRISPSVLLSDVLVVPDFNVHLLSVNKLVHDSGLGVYFSENNCYLCIKQGLLIKPIVEIGEESRGLYWMENCRVSCQSSSWNSQCYVSKLTWHNRLGHPSDQVLRVLKDSLGYDDGNILPCDVCHKAKQTREPFSLSEHRTTSLGEIVHLDVWGPYRVATRDGFRFFSNNC